MTATPDSPLPDFNAMTRAEILTWIDEPGNIILLLKYGEPGELPDFNSTMSPEDIALLKQGINTGHPRTPW